MTRIVFAMVALLCWPIAAAAQGNGAGLGVVEFANSGSPAAQASFIRGLALLHSFEYWDADDAFRAAEAGLLRAETTLGQAEAASATRADLARYVKVENEVDRPHP